MNASRSSGVAVGAIARSAPASRRATDSEPATSTSRHSPAASRGLIVSSSRSSDGRWRGRSASRRARPAAARAARRDPRSRCRRCWPRGRAARARATPARGPRATASRPGTAARGRSCRCRLGRSASASRSTSGRSASTAAGAKARRTTLRSRVWSGGSRAIKRLRAEREQLADLRLLGGDLLDPGVVLGRPRAVEAIRAPGARVEHDRPRGRRVGDHPAAGCRRDAQASSSVWAALRACLTGFGDCSIAAVTIAPSKRKKIACAAERPPPASATSSLT